jgi:PIN domain nuclease of toxin-antitoxin system
VRALLDTHALFWRANGLLRLSKKVRQLLASLEADVFVSAASAWEPPKNVRLRKLPEGAEFAMDFTANVQRLGFHPLPIAVDQCRRAGLLPGLHKDPFDRIAIAQTRAENMPIVSNEQAFDEYMVRRIW